jgi:methyl-accepting chemotaxis protein
MFRKLPLAIKLSMGSCLAVLGALVLCWTAFVGFRSIEANLDYIGRVAEPRAAVLFDLESRLNDVHTKALRTSLWQTAGVREEQINELIASIGVDIKALVQQTQNNITPSEDDKALFTALITYRKVILEALDFVNDPAIASGYFRRADQNYAELLVKIQKAVALSHEGLTTNIQTANSHAHDALNSFLLLTVSILCAVAFVNVLAIRLVLVGLRDAVEQISCIEKGELNIDVRNRDAHDLIGDVARSVESLRLQLMEADVLRQQRDQQAQRQAQERRSSQMAVADLFERQVSVIVERVLQSTKDLENSARDLYKMAHKTSLSTEEIVRATDETSANFMRVASATEELSSSVSEIARQVDESARFADQAVVQSSQSSDGVRALIASSERISDINVLIDNVAGKTNLLALNATIEAARAGEQGRGFAIVAQEVKSLATQTVAATSDIASHIQNIQSSTRHAQGLMQGVSHTIEQISSISSTIAANLQEQNLATKEIAQGMSYAATSADTIAKTTNDVNDIAHKSSAAAEDVLASASDLHEEASKLNAEIITFLASVRAA